MPRCLGRIIIVTALLLAATGCSPAATSPSPSTTSIHQISEIPLEVVSVEDTYQPGDLVNPAGPEIKITLKNVYDEPIVSLSVTLEEPGDRSYDFSFPVTHANPWKPETTVSTERTLIGGGWGGGITYSLKISGNTGSGGLFAFTWEP